MNDRSKYATLKNFWFLPLAIAIFGACNIEVGNPDSGDAPSPGMHRLNVAVAGGSACTSSDSAGCVSVPVKVSDSVAADLRFEATTVSLNLATTQLKPQAGEATPQKLNLLYESTIALQTTDLSGSAESLVLGFASSGEAVLQIKGEVVGTLDGVKLRLPLTLTETGALSAETAMTGDGIVSGVIFDANQWFDFSESTPAIEQFAKGLTGGACRDALSDACTRFTAQASRLIAERVMRSMAVQERQRSTPAGRILPKR